MGCVTSSVRVDPNSDLFVVDAESGLDVSGEGRHGEFVEGMEIVGTAMETGQEEKASEGRSLAPKSPRRCSVSPLHGGTRDLEVEFGLSQGDGVQTEETAAANLQPDKSAGELENLRDNDLHLDIDHPTVERGIVHPNEPNQITGDTEMGTDLIVTELSKSIFLKGVISPKKRGSPEPRPNQNQVYFPIKGMRDKRPVSTFDLDIRCRQLVLDRDNFGAVKTRPKVIEEVDEEEDALAETKTSQHGVETSLPLEGIEEEGNGNLHKYQQNEMQSLEINAVEAIEELTLGQVEREPIRPEQRKFTPIEELAKVSEAAEAVTEKEQYATLQNGVLSEESRLASLCLHDRGEGAQLIEKVSTSDDKTAALDNVVEHHGDEGDGFTEDQKIQNQAKSLKRNLNGNHLRLLDESTKRSEELSDFINEMIQEALFMCDDIDL